MTVISVIRKEKLVEEINDFMKDRSIRSKTSGASSKIVLLKINEFGNQKLNNLFY